LSAFLVCSYVLIFFTLRLIHVLALFAMHMCKSVFPYTGVNLFCREMC